MADFGIVAEPRTIVGKKVKQLRLQGLVPAVMYGKEEPVNLQLDDRKLREIFRAGAKDAQIDLTIGGEKKMVIVRELQRHVLRGDLLHVDFLEISATDMIAAEVTVVLVDVAPVLTVEQGMISQLLQTVEVESIAANMVGEIEVSLSSMATATDTILVKDMVAPEGIVFTTDPDTMVARFRAAAVVEEVVEEGIDSGAAPAAAEDSAE